MKSSENRSVGKFIVIIGYILVVIIMIAGLVAIYKNLVDFTEKKIRDEDLTELIIVGNTISKLYEVESTQNLLSYESAESYFKKYDSIRPTVIANLDTLKNLSKDSTRIVKLDSIAVLLSEKERNFKEISALLDSIKKSPKISRETVSTFVPKSLNEDIERYLKQKNIDVTEDITNDTTVVKGEKKGFFRRIGDAIVGKEDSTLIVKSQPVITRGEFKLAIDTVVNMVRYSERLNLEAQKKFQFALIQRQAAMNNTNLMLTSRIDELLTAIEQEEINKSMRLLEEKNMALKKSQKTLFTVSWLAAAVSIIFGFLYLLDINRSQRYRKRIEESNRKINQLLKSREKLMLSISHDIKAPMSSIQGFIELMESGADENSRKKYLQNMKQSSDHVLQLVTNLLDYQKIESGTWMRNDLNFNVFEVVDNTAKSFKPIAGKKQLHFNIHNNIPLNLMAYGDPFMIRDICGNLISNAIKYTHKGKVDIFADIERENLLKFSVKDTGSGIDEKYQTSIFNEFVQIKSQNNGTPIEGSGLGLPIVKGLVEQLGGTIKVQSEKGKGSEFIVYLPLEASRSSELFVEEKDDLERVEIENISVLAVDDDPIQLAMFSEMLKRKNIRVVSETNPEKVLGILKDNSFDFVFLDIQMPNMSGLVLMRQIIDSGLLKPETAPVIALSAKSDISAQDYKKSGFTDFLNKPFTSTQLFRLINKHLEHRFAEEDNDEKSRDGVFALIELVKDDKATSIEILHAFIEDTKINISELQQNHKVGNLEKTSYYAHKMLPLFKMMGDEKLSAILEKMDRKESVSQEDTAFAINQVNQHIQEAERLLTQIENKQ